MKRRIAWLLAILGAMLWLGAANAPAAHRCSWSYFGDPRAIVYGHSVVWGCVTGRGSIVVGQYDPRTGARRHTHLHRFSEVDDHNNPALVIWRGRLHAFYAPHSGRFYPRSRRSRMLYRVSKRRGNLRGGFGRERSVATNTAGDLGYTYPNPVPAADKLWLFWRGGNWQPSFSYTRDGVHWTPARTLVIGPEGQRPYAKYAGGADGSIHMIFTPGHVRSQRNSLYYMRYRAGRFLAADGRVIGRMRDLPLRIGDLDVIYRFSPQGGRAWPHDIAVEDGRPVVAYTRRVGGPNGRDHFVYARWDGARWRSHGIVSAGRPALTFTSGGITLDHGRPWRVVLSRRTGAAYEVELWSTADGGRTWAPPVAVRPAADARNIRPLIPRGYVRDPVPVLYVHGPIDCYRTFRRIRSVIRLAFVSLPVKAPWDTVGWLHRVTAPVRAASRPNPLLASWAGTASDPGWC